MNPNSKNLLRLVGLALDAVLLPWHQQSSLRLFYQKTRLTKNRVRINSNSKITTTGFFPSWVLVVSLSTMLIEAEPVESANKSLLSPLEIIANSFPEKSVSWLNPEKNSLLIEFQHQYKLQYGKIIFLLPQNLSPYADSSPFNTSKQLNQLGWQTAHLVFADTSEATTDISKGITDALNHLNQASSDEVFLLADIAQLAQIKNWASEGFSSLGSLDGLVLIADRLITDAHLVESILQQLQNSNQPILLIHNFQRNELQTINPANNHNSSTIFVSGELINNLTHLGLFRVHGWMKKLALAGNK